MKKTPAKGNGSRGDALPPGNARVRNQLPTRAERFVRKRANIEDLPDAKQVRDAEKAMKRTRKGDNLIG